MKCPLCGLEFDERHLPCHASCAWGRRCAIICCPECGFQLVDESRSSLAALLRRTLRRLPRGTGGRRRLSELSAGQSAVVAFLDPSRPRRLERLTVLGVTPGSRLVVEQQRPVCVFRLGHSELSVEREVADTILVDPDP